MSYEESNWAKLSPAFRDAHNRLRQARGQETIPPPKVDLYVKPQPRPARVFDPGDKEFLGAVREFHGGAIPGAFAQGEGFTINGTDISFGLNEAERLVEKVMRARQAVRAVAPVDDGFRINGRPVR